MVISPLFCGLIWWFPEMGVPPNHLFIDGFSTMNHPFRVPPFMETSINSSSLGRQPSSWEPHSHSEGTLHADGAAPLGIVSSKSGVGKAQCRRQGQEKKGKTGGWPFFGSQNCVSTLFSFTLTFHISHFKIHISTIYHFLALQGN